MSNLEKYKKHWEHKVNNVKDISNKAKLLSILVTRNFEHLFIESNTSNINKDLFIGYYGKDDIANIERSCHPGGHILYSKSEKFRVLTAIYDLFYEDDKFLHAHKERINTQAEENFKVMVSFIRHRIKKSKKFK